MDLALKTGKKAISCTTLYISRPRLSGGRGSKGHGNEAVYYFSLFAIANSYKHGGLKLTDLAPDGFGNERSK